MKKYFFAVLFVIFSLLKIEAQMFHPMFSIGAILYVYMWGKYTTVNHAGKEEG
jgi:hypothetical protein